jgi:hypothetical protein
MRETTAVALGFLLILWMGTAFPTAAGRPPKIGDAAPEITGMPWINSPPLILAELRGKVVLVEFWTHG